jgi:hypothetical protein
MWRLGEDQAWKRKSRSPRSPVVSMRRPGRYAHDHRLPDEDAASRWSAHPGYSPAGVERWASPRTLLRRLGERRPSRVQTPQSSRRASRARLPATPCVAANRPVAAALADRPVPVVDELLDLAPDRHLPALRLRLGLLECRVRDAPDALELVGPAALVLRCAASSRGSTPTVFLRGPRNAVVREPILLPTLTPGSDADADPGSQAAAASSGQLSGARRCLVDCS